ncbi:uncharacterized protein K444DRAFT_617278 [Hyaloscypha bicolor E]|uniref:Uncharacterized protein n=1 Tax=Hyaloscypha bicolor E TaxID=1095630 RepID=A0A2J6SVL0_9HELO|nr:uncharacterized protein K444DRAFT_617278 [Hyaloscypha bicolor E]PMD54815.1 hypothetical protein K444DRAFT_617278 [Hyaloscypha bicolor E]
MLPDRKSYNVRGSTALASRHRSKWPTSLLFGYVFALGVLGLLFRATWRRKLLRHVNVLLILNFMLILISDNLPRALLHTVFLLGQSFLGWFLCQHLDSVF